MNRSISLHGGPTHVVCPSCAGQAILCRIQGRLTCLACAYSDMSAKPKATLPARCLACGAQTRPKRHAYRPRCDACGTEITVRERPDWEVPPLPLWAEISTRHGTIWANNPDHLAAMRDYISRSHRRPFDPIRGTHRLANSDWRARLPRWMVLGKNRVLVLKTLDRLEIRFAQTH